LDIKENWETALAGRKATLKIKVELRPDSLIEGDSKLLRLALGNLIENAMESLGQNGWVSIKLSNGSLQSDNGQENAVVFSIEDNGSGITSDMPERILEPFFSTRRMKVGLGLPIVVRIVQQHRGQFSFHSERNQGSLFKITLPTLQTGRLYV
jgi:signal transduction histidine kinase